MAIGHLEGQAVVVSGGGTELRVWDLWTGEEIPTGFRINKSDLLISSLAIGQLNGDTIAVLGTTNDVTTRRGEVDVWDLTNDKRLDHLLWAPGEVSAVALAGTSDHPLMVVGGDTHGHGAVHLLDLANQQGQASPIPPAAPVTAVTFAQYRDRSIVAAGVLTQDIQNPFARFPSELRLWDAQTGQRLGPPIPHTDLIRGMAVTSVDGRLIALTGTIRSAQVRLWNIETGASEGTLNHAAGKEDETDLSVAQVEVVSHDDRQLAVTLTKDGSFGEVWVWDLTSNELVAGPLLAKSFLNAMAVATTRQGLLIAAGYGYLESGEIALWNQTTGQAERDPVPHAWPVHALEISAWEGHTVVVSSSAFNERDGLGIWSVQTGNKFRRLLSDIRGTGVLAMAPGPHPLVAVPALDRQIRLWHPLTASEQCLFVGAAVHALAMSPDRHVFVGTPAGLACLRRRGNSSAPAANP
ncbi:hypothetical protein HLK59_24185 [Streptomyces sp. S3(2020)]|nr:hypothetical protein [Streptomyces sp. S3(2020)]